jgi:non-ribosomal peptide synthetase component E (peptide arylation enzyme)
VFGLPDKRLGEVVGTAIWCTDESITEKMLSDHAANVVAKFKVPEPINIFFHREALPKGATGKLDKKGLRDTYGEIVEGRTPVAKL